MFEPKATASHLDSTIFRLAASPKVRRKYPTKRTRRCTTGPHFEVGFINGESAAASEKSVAPFLRWKDRRRLEMKIQIEMRFQSLIRLLLDLGD
jgi:hypothetical protein